MARITLIASEYPPGPGGIGHHAYSLTQALNVEGYTMQVLSPADFADAEETNAFDRKQAFEVHRYSRIGALTYFLRIYKSYREIRRFEPEALILTGKFSLWQGLFLKYLFPKTPSLAILHGSEVNLANPKLRAFTHKAISKVDKIVSVSNFTESLLPQWILESRKNDLHIIPNGIDKGIPYDKVQRQNSFLTGSPKLLTVGHVSPRKGQHRVIKALPRLIQIFPDIHYHIVGRPVYQEKLETLAKELQVEKYISFHGRVKQHADLAQYYEAADIFMLLSENLPNGDVEGFGIVALEANSFGIPVIGARYCGVEDAVSHMKSGYLVDGNSEEEILEGLQYCLTRKDKLSQASIEWAESHDWRALVKQYISLLS